MEEDEEKERVLRSTEKCAKMHSLLGERKENCIWRRKNLKQLFCSTPPPPPNNCRGSIKMSFVCICSNVGMYVVKNEGTLMLWRTSEG